MTYAIEHCQQFTSKWCIWETFEDKELADKELHNLLLRFPRATFRLTHSPD